MSDDEMAALDEAMIIPADPIRPPTPEEIEEDRRFAEAFNAGIYGDFAALREYVKRHLP